MDANLNKSNNPVLSILVVDDDELNRRMMQLLLKREGHLTQCVTNGQEAFDAVKNGSFDMILMDLQMPVMDGVEASRRIREWESDAKHIYIVALTASYLPERGAELFQAGIDNYIAKPFDVDHLRNILQSGLENRETKNLQSADDASATNLQASHTFDPELGIKRVGGDLEIYKEFLQEFVDELPGKLEVLWTCARNHDDDGLGRAAHNLKGVSGNLGALQLSEHARKLENTVSAGYTGTVENLLSEIMTVSVKFKEDTTTYLSGKGL